MSSQTGDLSVLSRASASTSARRPSVPRPASRWKTRVLLPWGIIGVALLLLGYASRDVFLPATSVHVVPVVVRSATETQGTADGAVTVQAPGWVEPDPYPIAVTALTDGVVAEVLALEGQSVKEGDVIARMVADDAKIALARAEATVLERDGELKQAVAAKDAAASDWENPVERTRAVAAGDAMLAESTAALERQGSEIAAEAARIEEFEDLVRRSEKTAAVNASSESELVQAKSKLKAQQAVLAAAKASEPVLAARVRQQKAELTAAIENAKLRITERRAVADSAAAVIRAEAALQQASAARDEAKLRLSRMEIRSPADGVVLSRYISPGSTMMQNTDNPASAHAIRLYDPKKLQVRVDIPLADAAKVSVGQRAKITVGVLPDRAFDGEVTRIVPEADLQRNTLQVKVRINDPAAELRPEMLARIRFDAMASSTTRESAVSQQVFVPESMLQLQPDGRAQVWIVDAGRGVAELRDVTAGDGRAGEWIAIREGLQPGDRLIALEDASSLRPGIRVKVVGEAQLPPSPTKTTGGSHGSH
jgi:HlyD family secretion protein